MSDRKPTLLSVADLRRPSPLHSPTRTLFITEAELAARDTTPVAELALRDRPRSNPRSRTPMRYESPLNPAEFRRESLENDAVPERNEARRISIRPLAGRAVGSIASTRVSVMDCGRLCWRPAQCRLVLSHLTLCVAFLRFTKNDRLPPSHANKVPLTERFADGTMITL